MSRLLLVTSRFPLPARRGNQVRTMQWLDALGHLDRVVIAPDPGKPELVSLLEDRGIEFLSMRLKPVPRAMSIARAVMAGTPLQEGLFATGAARRKVASVLASACFDLVIVQMIRCGWAIEVLRRFPKPPPVLFDAIDSMSLHFRRGSEFGCLPMRWIMSAEAHRCYRREQWMIQHSALTVAVASRDLRAMEVGEHKGRVIPVAGRVVRRETVGKSTPTVLLSGNLGYRPTADGAAWFAENVWPRLRRDRPELRWVIVGARPPRAVRKLENLNGVEVHGDVDDLAPFFERATVAIAPMRSGSGVPMKILEAWASGLPVIATSWSAEGVEAGKSEALLVADSADQWVRGVEKVLDDRQYSASLTNAGRAVFERVYQEECIRRASVEAVDTILQSNWD